MTPTWGPETRPERAQVAVTSLLSPPSEASHSSLPLPHNLRCTRNATLGLPEMGVNVHSAHCPHTQWVWGPREEGGVCPPKAEDLGVCISVPWPL